MVRNNSASGIVILGMPRSGTTLLRRLLDAHPAIACAGETFLLRATARLLKSDRVADGIDYGMLGGLTSAGFDKEEVLRRIRAFAFGFLDDIAARAEKSRWASKTAVDSFYLREIERIYGGHVRFLCIVRHGLDTVCSLRDLCEVNETYIEELHDYIVRYPAPMEAFAHAWSDVTRNLLDLAARRTEDTLLLRYEDLVRTPQPVLKHVFEFLAEEFPPGLLEEAFATTRVHGLGDWKTYSTTRIETKSMGRFEELSEASVSRLGAIVNPVLELAGYDRVACGPEPHADEAMRRYELQLTMRSALARDGDGRK